MLELNYHLRNSKLPGPYKIAVLIRTVARWIKARTKKLFRLVQRSRAGDTEAAIAEEKTVDKSLEEYRQTLRRIFGNSERVDEVIDDVRSWFNVERCIYPSPRRVILCHEKKNKWLKNRLARRLWGYPYLADIVFSEYADVRRRDLEDRRRRQNETEDTSSVSEKEASPPPPPVPYERLWAFADAEDVNPEFMLQGPDWYALFNPNLGRSLDVSLVHTLPHDRCVSSISSRARANEVRLFTAQSSVVRCVRFSVEGRFLAIGHCDGSAQIYDAKEGAKKWSEQPLSRFIYSLICITANSLITNCTRVIYTVSASALMAPTLRPLGMTNE